MTTNFVDHHTRFVINNFLINLFHYYWTNFWFLIPTVLLTFLLYSQLYLKFFNLYYNILLAIIIIYFFTLIHYWCGNAIIFEMVSKKENLNPLLTNSINKYHPFLLYWSSVWILILVLNLNNSNVKANIRLAPNQNYQNLIPHAFIVNLITLSLGGWWALQEGSWGGWWNWDPSEVFGLLVMLTYLTAMHTNWLYKNQAASTKTYFYAWFIIILIVYTLIQLNFDLVSHNFGTRIHQFVNSYYIYLVTLICFCYSFYVNVRQNKMNFTTFSHPKNKPTHFLILNFLLLTVLLVSFNELFVNFIWTLFNFNVLNLTISIGFISLIILILLIARYYKLTLFSFVLICFSLTWPWYSKLLLLFVIGFGSASSLHKLIFLWVLLTPFYLSQSVSEWSPYQTNLGNYFFSNVATQDLLLLKVNVSYVELISLFNNSNYLVDVGWGFLHKTSSLLNMSFSHLLNKDTCIQLLNSSHLEFKYVIEVFDHNTSILITILILAVYYANKFLIRNPIIIF